jgi:hypothetical protein
MKILHLFVRITRFCLTDGGSVFSLSNDAANGPALERRDS